MKDVEQQENLKFDIVKNEFSKLYVEPVQIKTEYQNAKEVKTDFVSDEEVDAELGSDYNPRVLNLRTKLTFEMLKIKFSNVKQKSLFIVIL